MQPFPTNGEAHPESYNPLGFPAFRRSGHPVGEAKRTGDAPPTPELTPSPRTSDYSARAPGSKMLCFRFVRCRMWDKCRAEPVDCLNPNFLPAVYRYPG
jgi:hypothetical protein